MEVNHKLLADKGLLLKDPVTFRRVVGWLVYSRIELFSSCTVSGDASAESGALGCYDEGFKVYKGEWSGYNVEV